MILVSMRQQAYVSKTGEGEEFGTVRECMCLRRDHRNLSLLALLLAASFPPSTAGIGGDCGLDLLGDVIASGVVEVGPDSLGRDFDRERDFRWGSTLGTWRYWEVIAGITRTCMEGEMRGQTKGSSQTDSGTGQQHHAVTLRICSIDRASLSLHSAAIPPLTAPSVHPITLCHPSGARKEPDRTSKASHGKYPAADQGLCSLLTPLHHSRVLPFLATGCRYRNRAPVRQGLRLAKLTPATLQALAPLPRLA
ncbi:hypothetical protein KC330_g70 [Hortaea werneckii]|nr:hypothetical protein KC330_g70 [Hortaea werneckii]